GRRPAAVHIAKPAQQPGIGQPGQGGMGQGVGDMGVHHDLRRAGDFHKDATATAEDGAKLGLPAGPFMPDFALQ
ncbi:MAG: hypothetical protein ACK4NH_14780, partial [Gemmobacter sp.]